MLPKAVAIREEAPREGFQFEKTVFPTEQKLELIDALAQTGLAEIEVGSLVRPDRVPQMADMDDLIRRLPRRPGVHYLAAYLNRKGLERGLELGIGLHHSFSLSASETFLRRNNNRDRAGALQDLAERGALLRQMGVSEVSLNVAAAFGCNYEGDVPTSHVLDNLRLLAQRAAECGLRPSGIGLMDTMGWANPGQVRGLIEAVRAEWPDLPIRLHLHDTRGLGLANAYAGLIEGVDSFDTALGGLGGCPFAGHRGAAGNIATEDFAFLCEELGVATGVDLDRLIECALLAERIVGHPLPGKVKVGGRLATYRLQRAAGG